MKCPKCKASIDDDSKYCTYCGVLIDDKKETKQDKEQEKLLDTFIDVNVDQIKERSFSLPTFLLGEFYFLYRRMYLLTLFAVITLILCMFLGDYIVLALLIRNTIFAFFFNKIYYNHALHKINKLDKQLSLDDKKRECKRMGGTSLFSVCIVSVPIFLLFILFIVVYISFAFANQRTPLGDKINTDNPILYDLTYKIPLNFESSRYNDSDSKFYSYMTDNYTYCSFSINQELSKNYLTTEEYLNTISDSSNSPIQEVKINNYPWSGVVINKNNYSTYYYASKYQDHYYSLKFKTYADDECLQYYKKVLNSLEFK